MGKVTIYHDKEAFEQEIATLVWKQKLFMYIDVVSRDSAPNELLAVVRGYANDGSWYSNGKTYSSYRHAFAAIGAAVDAVNPQRSPLSDEWIS